jgi:hypothetical protein
MRTSSLSIIGTLALASFAACVAACAASGGNHFTTGSGAGGPGGAGGAGSTSGETSNSSGSLGGGGSFTTVGSGTTATTSGSGGSTSFIAYAHDNTTLFTLDPAAPTLSVTKVGNFDCIGGSGQDTSMTDVAVDSQGNVWGISSHYVYSLQVQGSKVHCAITIPLNNPKSVKFYALTFAPAGVIDLTKEVLIGGNTAGELWAIDTTNGTLTQHGTLGTVPTHDGQGHNYPVNPGSNTGNTVGTAWELSGDIVFLANNGNPVGFATVRDCPSPPSSSNCDNTDTLLQIDMNKLKAAGAQSVSLGLRGAVVQKSGCADASNPKGYGSMYGIAAWNDKVYGFSHTGAIVEIDNNTGAACLVLDTANDLWAGAGVTTLAPVTPPPPPPQ